MMSNSRFNYLCLALLFGASFLVLNWMYGYVIAFQRETNDCFFLFGRSFLLEFFDHPAAPLRYAGRFFGQFYHYRWLGALIVSASITGFGFLFYRVLAKLEDTVPVSQTLLPCAFLLALHTSTLYTLQDTLGLCAVCSVFLGYISLSGGMLKRAYALVATPMVYFCAGVYVWILVAWIVVFECLDRSRRLGLGFAAGYAAFSAALPIAAWRWVFLVPLRSAVMCPVMFGPPFRTGSPEQSTLHFVTDCTLAVGLCAVLLLIPFWTRVFSGTSLASFWLAKPDKRTRVAMFLALGALGILLHWVRYDAPLATVVACRQLYKARQWEALLERAKKTPYQDHRVQFMVNFALYHEGKLLDEMFNYPQPWGTRGLFMNFSGVQVLSPEEDDSFYGMYNSDLLYEMGHANFALRHAYNSMCLYGETYETLTRMAQCSMLNGNNAMAEKYLNLLNKTLFHRDIAEHYKAILEDRSAEDREFSELRKRLPVTDGFGHPVRYFITLLEAKPDNRMAVDYLMAWLLLEKQPDSVPMLCANVNELKAAGYTSIPVHCQEAILLQERSEHTSVDLHGFHFDEATVARVDKFLREMLEKDTEYLRTHYGDTYMYYNDFVTPRGDVRSILEASRRFSTSREE